MQINAPLFDLIARAEAWLDSNDYPNQVLKWETDVWGSDPGGLWTKVLPAFSFRWG